MPELCPVRTVPASFASEGDIFLFAVLVEKKQTDDANYFFSG